MSRRPIQKHEEEDEEEEEESDTGSIGAGNSRLARFLRENYDIEIIPDARQLTYRPVYICIDTSDDRGVNLFASKSISMRDQINNSATVMIAAIVLEEYSLQGTLYPVTIQLKSDSGSDLLPGTACTRAHSTWSAVLVPGHQHTIHDKVMFEPPVRDMKLARRFYPDIKLSSVKKGVSEITTNGKVYARLSIYSSDDTPEKAECPLGYTLNASGKIYEKLQTTENGVTRTYLQLSAHELKAAEDQFYMDAQDARPTLPLTSIKACAKILESGSEAIKSTSASFVLSMKMGIFCYNM